MWNSQVIHIIELTVPFETTAINAAKQKTHRYQDLHEACALRRWSSVMTLEVGSRGFLYAEGFQKLYSLLCTKSNSRQNFEVKVIREVMRLPLTFGTNVTGVPSACCLILRT